MSNNLLENKVEVKKLSTKEISFGKFSDKIIGYFATTFSPMFYRVFKKHWNNSWFARVRKNYFYSNFQQGIAEVYIPTFQHLDFNMNYHRIVIKVVPYLDKKIMKEESDILRKRKFNANGRGAMGVVDSQTIVLVAQHISPEALKEWRKDRKRKELGLKPKREWYLRAKRILSGHVMIMPIICMIPEIVMKRLLTVLKKFYDKRIKNFVESFHLMKFHYDRYSMVNTLYYITSIIENNISLALGNALKCLSSIYDWLNKKQNQIIKHLARQTQLINLFKQINQIKPLLREIKQKNNPFKIGADPKLLTSLIEILQVH